MVGSDILGNEGTMLQISAQTNNSSYVKQILLSQLGLKTLISHGLNYAECTEASTVWFSEWFS